MNYLVIGYGKSGKAAANLLTKKGHKVFVYDERVDLSPMVSDGVTILKKVTPKVLEDIDMCVVSPSVRPDSETLKKVNAKGIKVIGELELGYTYHKGKVYAITGTNGKTTAVTLLNHILKKSSLVGNVGEPITNHTDDGTLVCEVSSFQALTIDKFRPNIAGITYIDSDHLDYHGSLQNYIDAKHNMTKNMTRKDRLVLNADDKNCMSLALKSNAKIYTFSTRDICKGVYIKDGKIYCIKRYKPKYVMDVKDVPLIGEHNLKNTLLVIMMAYLSGMRLKEIAKKVKTFKPLNHRMQKVAEVEGVTYINDSKATNISASIAALESMEEGSTILLAGGSSKGYEYDELITGLNVKKLIIFGGVKDKIIEACKRNEFNNYIVADKLFDAVSVAKSIASSGDTVLLSPASASYDEFRNYEERGYTFEKYVLSNN